jgi:6-phosphogluconolactonase
VTRLTTVADPEAAARRAAELIARDLRDAVQRRGVAHLGLAGGNTPRRAYELLAGLLDDWSAVELWYGDERCVGPDDPQSNHRLVADSLLAGIAAGAHAATDAPSTGPTPAPASDRPRGGGPLEHRIPGELGPDAAAQAYTAELRARVAPADDGAGGLGTGGGAGGLPSLDVALLGLGEDGHTASLFPGHPEVLDEGALCLPVRDAPKPPPERVTLSLPVLRAARHCLLLATGAGKAAAVAAVLAGPGGRDFDTPASLLASGRLQIVIDDAASPPSRPPTGP